MINSRPTHPTPPSNPSRPCPTPSVVLSRLLGKLRLKSPDQSLTSRPHPWPFLAVLGLSWPLGLSLARARPRRFHLSDLRLRRRGEEGESCLEKFLGLCRCTRCFHLAGQVQGRSKPSLRLLRAPAFARFASGTASLANKRAASLQKMSCRIAGEAFLLAGTTRVVMSTIRQASWL